MRLLLLAALVVVATPATYAFYFACHRCRKAASHEDCNKQGIEFCRLDQGACVTRVKEKRGGRLEISKGCRKLKQCRFRCKGGKYKRCNYCCFNDMCNVGDWPPPAEPCGCRPCQNGGKCQRTATGFRCICPKSYTGRYCERRVTVPVNPCDRKPCRNGGTCENLICPGRYRCVCPPGYTGANCETHINPCRTRPCVNGGTCLSSGGSFTCKCRPGFAGVRCEKETSPCARNPCQNGGTCTPHCSGYTCLCRPGYTGRNCETGTQCFRCPAEAGLFPDPFDCTKFYHCSHWTAYHKDCPANLHFNPTLKVCDWPFNAGCQQHRPNQDQERVLRGGSCMEADSCAFEEDDEDEEETKRDDIPGSQVSVLVEELRHLLEDELTTGNRGDTKAEADPTSEQEEDTDGSDDQATVPEEKPEGNENQSDQEATTEVKDDQTRDEQSKDEGARSGLTPVEEEGELEEMEHEIRELRQRLDNMAA